ncbi:uncharacterized protein N7482_010481 [Penicillium canariense]|uniref:Uncharacterized protein n=1 Tax=Penicillium canariense TaxID=189055 RepID=A0A9W9HP80_9EURO|nr:uncharacterized protein N7482_010481 [Penicillium canariense]KAJ5151229.1 hypothetical protein N7482_010481 [Penicillium canariense]
MVDVPTTTAGPKAKSGKKPTNNQRRLDKLEGQLRDIQFGQVKQNAQIAAIKFKLESLQSGLDRHQAALEALALYAELVHQILAGKTDK